MNEAPDHHTAYLIANDDVYQTPGLTARRFIRAGIGAGVAEQAMMRAQVDYVRRDVILRLMWADARPRRERRRGAPTPPRRLGNHHHL